MLIQFTPEMMEKIKACKSAQELFELAKENGFELSKEEAEKQFADINKTGDISDEELGNVSGGGCSGEVPLVQKCVNCQLQGVRWERLYPDHPYGHFVCPRCGNEWGRAMAVPLDKVW